MDLTKTPQAIDPQVVTTYLRPGTILWRQFTNGKLATGEFKPSDKGGFIGRTVIPGTMCCEPEISMGDKGIVTFLKEQPLHDWNHLIVSGISKNGKCVFVECGDPFLEFPYFMEHAPKIAHCRANVLAMYDDYVQKIPMRLPGKLKRLFCVRASNQLMIADIPPYVD